MKHAVIVGGTSGIGRAAAAAMIARGWRATVASRTRRKVEAAVAGLGPEARAGDVDVTDPERVAAFAAGFEDASVDALLITASTVARGRLEEADPAAFLSMLDSKLVGAFRVAQAMRPKLAEGGSITFCGGVLSRRGGAGASGLAATDAGLEGMTRALAAELGPALRVNCLGPGLTRTEAYAGMDDDAREAMFERAAAALPAGRVGAAQDVAAAAVMLMENPFITGTVLDVDGGRMVAG